MAAAVLSVLTGPFSAAPNPASVHSIVESACTASLLLSLGSEGRVRCLLDKSGLACEPDALLAALRPAEVAQRFRARPQRAPEPVFVAALRC